MAAWRSDHAFAGVLYQRQRITDRGFGANRGKSTDVLDWYQRQYSHARNDIQLGSVADKPAVFFENSLLNDGGTDGLIETMAAEQIELPAL